MLQTVDVGGLLVDSVEECAHAVVALLRDPDRAAEQGAAANACASRSCPRDCSSTS